MTTAIAQRSVSFHGDSLFVIHQTGTDYTPVKPLCDILGIDLRDEVLSEGASMMEAPSAGGPQQMLCLPLDYLNGWLFGVDVGRIRPELRERLILYKRECYRVLAGAQGGAIEPARLAAIETRLDAIEAERRATLPVTTGYLSPLAEAIIGILQARHAGGPVHSRLIIAELRRSGYEVSPRPIWLRLRRMAARGLIERCGRGAYRLAKRTCTFYFFAKQ